MALAPVWARLAVLSGWLALLFREASAGKLLPAWGSIGAVALVAIAASSILLIESLVGGSRPDGAMILSRVQSQNSQVALGCVRSRQRAVRFLRGLCEF